MAIDFSGAGSAVDTLFGGLGAFDTAKGYKAQAKGYERAAEISTINKGIAKQASQIELMQAERDIYRTLGSARTAIGGSGLAASGSALDILRDSATQGNLTKQLLGRQEAIEQLAYDQERISYEGQAAAAKAAAKSSKKSGIGGLISGGIKLGLSLFSDDDLKENVKLLYRRSDGLGIYSFRYNGQPTTFKGVLASEVEKLYPSAVTRDAAGDRMVDYEAIAVTPEVIHA